MLCLLVIYNEIVTVPEYEEGLVSTSAHIRTHGGKTENVHSRVGVLYNKNILNGERMSKFIKGAVEMVTTIGREH